MAKYTEELFEEIWRYREEEIYPKLFGVESEGISPIPFERLAGRKDSRSTLEYVWRISDLRQRPSVIPGSTCRPGSRTNGLKRSFRRKTYLGSVASSFLETTERAIGRFTVCIK